jgi:aspartate racemase
VRHRLCVGVLGGMGPEATADFYAKLVAETPSARDQDHLRVLIDGDPSVPDRSAGIEGSGESPGPHLARMARGLVAMGAELLVMPCNSAHAFEAEIRGAIGAVPFLSLIDATVAATLEAVPGVRRVGLLATDGTLRARVYADGFAAAEIEALAPDAADQRTVMEAIYDVKRGRGRARPRSALVAVAGRLAAAGAEAVIAACTEVPLVLASGDVVVDGRTVPVISSTDALVARTIAAAMSDSDTD